MSRHAALRRTALPGVPAPSAPVLMTSELVLHAQPDLARRAQQTEILIQQSERLEQRAVDEGLEVLLVEQVVCEHGRSEPAAAIAHGRVHCRVTLEDRRRGRIEARAGP